MAFYRCGGGTDTSEVTATAEDVLSPKVIVNADGDAVTGTMTNQGAKTATLNAGGSYTIPKGYHNGNGKVTAKTLASQTSATATAAEITKGYTAWVNGSKITGTNASVTVNGSSITNNTNFKSVTRDVIRFNDIPYQFYDGSAVVYYNAIHILGTQYSGIEDAYYVWRGDDWIHVGTLPYDFYDGSAVVYNNEIHILGGAGDFTKHYKGNGTGAWISVSKLPYEFWLGSAVVYNNEIHILGCLKSADSTRHYKWNGSSWIRVSTLPYEFSDGAAVVYNNEIHILGGRGNKTRHYKWNGSSWSQVSTLPYEFYGGSAVVCDNNIYLLGGAGSSSSSRKFYRFNGSSWSSVMTLPYDFEEGAAVVFEGATHILGGYYNDSKQRHCELASTKYYI